MDASIFQHIEIIALLLNVNARYDLFLFMLSIILFKNVFYLSIRKVYQSISIFIKDRNKREGEIKENFKIFKQNTNLK